MSQINQIEAIAMRLEGCTNPIDPKVIARIREWSRFLPKPRPGEPPRTEPIDMGDRKLCDLKPFWIQTILWNGQKAEKQANKRAASLPLFDGMAPAKRTHRGRKPPQSGREWVPTGVDTNKRGPNDGEYNHPEDLPF